MLCKSSQDKLIMFALCVLWQNLPEEIEQTLSSEGQISTWLFLQTQTQALKLSSYPKLHHVGHEEASVYE